MKKYLFIALSFGFVVLGFIAYQKSVPINKDTDIYKKIKIYSPYYIKRRIGGLSILSKSDKEFKVKPTNTEVFHILDKLEQSWGKRYLKVLNSELIVMNDENKTVVKIPISSKKDKDFLNSFYGVR